MAGAMEVCSLWLGPWRYIFSAAVISRAGTRRTPLGKSPSPSPGSAGVGVADSPALVCTAVCTGVAAVCTGVAAVYTGVAAVCTGVAAVCTGVAAVCTGVGKQATFSPTGGT